MLFIFLRIWLMLHMVMMWQILLLMIQKQYVVVHSHYIPLHCTCDFQCILDIKCPYKNTFLWQRLDFAWTAEETSTILTSQSKICNICDGLIIVFFLQCYSRFFHIHYYGALKTLCIIKLSIISQVTSLSCPLGRIS